MQGDLFVAPRQRCPPSSPPRALSLPRKPQTHGISYYSERLLAHRNDCLLEVQKQVSYDFGDKIQLEVTMPIFEYKCLKCESEFEKLVFGKSTNGIICPDCQSQDIEQLYSSFNGVSRGSDGTAHSMSSGCSSCSASSCAGCKN
jgi:putative FmdB family regulatory protein